MKSLVFLTDADLGELGFNMGQRKLLLEWIRGQRADSQASPSQASQNIEDDSHVLAETVAETAQVQTPSTSFQVQRTPRRIHMLKVRMIRLMRRGPM